LETSLLVVSIFEKLVQINMSTKEMFSPAAVLEEGNRHLGPQGRDNVDVSSVPGLGGRGNRGDCEKIGKGGKSPGGGGNKTKI